LIDTNKIEKIRTQESVPTPEDGFDGEVITGIVSDSGKRLIAVKYPDGWYYSELSNKLNFKDEKLNVELKKEIKKALLLTQQGASGGARSGSGGGSFLPLAGGTVTGTVHMDDGVRIEFGDADEYIGGDGSKLYISSTNWVNFTDSRIEAINRILWTSGTMDDFKDEDDMASDSNSSAPSQQSVKAYVDNNSHIKVAKVALSESDMNSLHTTAVTIVPAQGTKNTIVPTSGMLFITRDSSTAQSNSASNLYVGYNGTSSSSETIYYLRRFMYNESGSRIWHLQHYTGEAGNSLSDGNDQPLTVKLNSAITSGSIDNMVISVSYYVYSS